VLAISLSRCVASPYDASIVHHVLAEGAAAGISFPVHLHMLRHATDLVPDIAVGLAEGTARSFFVEVVRPAFGQLVARGRVGTSTLRVSACPPLSSRRLTRTRPAQCAAGALLKKCWSAGKPKNSRCSAQSEDLMTSARRWQ
jgi:hypothetical protein